MIVDIDVAADTGTIGDRYDLIDYKVAATLLTPAGAITDPNPTYTWNAVATATWYYLWVNDSKGTPIKQWYTAEQAGCADGVSICAVTPSKDVANGAATWWIQTWNIGGYGPWSEALGFTVNASLPPAATLIAPTGAILDPKPTYTWDAVPTASWYYLWVNDGAGTKIKQWYTAEQAGCADGTGVCAVTPSQDIVNGAATWWIQTWNINGYGPWSEGLEFSSLPPAATLIAPTGTIPDPNPTYTWNAVPTATWYYLWVNYGTGPKIQQWYTAEQAGCADGTGVCAVTPSQDITNGAATWWIQTWNINGYGPWSEGLEFTVNGSPPPPAEPICSPICITLYGYDCYSWNAVPTASWYYLWVNDSKGTPIKQWYTAEQAGCADGTGVCTVVDPAPTEPGNGWWIGTWNINGYGPWRGCPAL